MNRIMIVNTSTGKFHPYNEKTGLWLSELVHFYDYFNKRGFNIDIFNIDSGKTPIDPLSLKPFILDNLTKKYYNSAVFMKLLNNSKAIEEADFEEYNCIYFTGGHGVMYDFKENESINSAVNIIYNKGGVIASVCHGTAALLNVKQEDGSYFVKDKDLTGFSNIEEKLARRENFIPYSLEDTLMRQGANYSKATIPMTPFVKVDGRIVTGQNPLSAKGVGREVHALLKR